VASYIGGVWIAIWGLLIVAVSLIAPTKVEPRPRRRWIAIGVLHGAFWLVIGCGLLIQKAVPSLWSPVVMLVAMGAVLVAWSVIGWPMWWRHLGDPDAWRGKVKPWE
jgi:peptidoglycan/LPS O-acetylase OafA/YrhL